MGIFQNQNRSVNCRKCIERKIQCDLLSMSIFHAFWQGKELFSCRARFVRIWHPIFALRFAEKINCQVRGYAQNQKMKRLLGIESLSHLINLDESFLYNIFSRFFVAEYSIGQPINVTDSSTKNSSKRRHVAVSKLSYCLFTYSQTCGPLNLFLLIIRERLAKNYIMLSATANQIRRIQWQGTVKDKMKFHFGETRLSFSSQIKEGGIYFLDRQSSSSTCVSKTTHLI